jgi:hypothetical protein
MSLHPELYGFYDFSVQLEQLEAALLTTEEDSMFFLNGPTAESIVSYY